MRILIKVLARSDILLKFLHDTLVEPSRFAAEVLKHL